jgi:hypothetical protein
LLQGLIDVGQDVVDVLEAYRQPDEVGRYASGELLLCRELLVRGGGRVDGQAARVAHVRDVRDQLQCIDELAALFGAALDAEAENGARPRP